MKAKIIFKGVAGYDSLVLKERLLSNSFLEMLKSLEINSLAEYFDYLLNDGGELNVLAVNYEVVKNFSVNDFFHFSSDKEDWAGNEDNWLMIEKKVIRYYMTDLVAQIVKKQLKGNILELEIVVIDIDNLLNFDY